MLQIKETNQLLPRSNSELRKELVRKSLRLEERNEVGKLNENIGEMASSWGGDPHFPISLIQNTFCHGLYGMSYRSLLTKKGVQGDLYDWMDYGELCDNSLAKNLIKERFSGCKKLRDFQDICFEAGVETREKLETLPEDHKIADMHSSDIPARIKDIEKELESRIKVLESFDSKLGWPRIISHPNIREGKSTLEGTRWTVYDIASKLEIEDCATAMDDWKGLTMPMIRATKHYLEKHPIATSA